MALKREIQGVVLQKAGDKTATILVERRVMHPRYHKFVKRFKKYMIFSMFLIEKEAETLFHAPVNLCQLKLTTY